MYMYFFFFIKLTFNSMGIQWVVNGTEESISCHLTPPNEVGTDGEVSRGTGCGGGGCSHVPTALMWLQPGLMLVPCLGVQVKAASGVCP